MKDIILENIKMIDILNKYGIKNKQNMFSCPFHGEDKNPSAKAYKYTFFCFTCQKTGDVIRFVQDYFNLSFYEAMQKINLDFNLGLDSNIKIDYNKLEKEKRKREQKQRLKKQKEDKYMLLSEKYRLLQNKIFDLKEQINILNWENKVYEISKLQEKLDMLEIELEEIFKTI